MSKKETKGNRFHQRERVTRYDKSVGGVEAATFYSGKGQQYAVVHSAFGEGVHHTHKSGMVAAFGEVAHHAHKSGMMAAFANIPPIGRLTDNNLETKALANTTEDEKIKKSLYESQLYLDTFCKEINQNTFDFLEKSRANQHRFDELFKSAFLRGEKGNGAA